MTLEHVDLATAVNMLCGVGIPVLVGLVTKAHASAALKAIVNAALSAVAGVLSVTVIDAHTDWRAIAFSVGTTWVVSVATHFGFWRPTGVTETVKNATKNIGFGRSVHKSIKHKPSARKAKAHSSDDGGAS